MGLIFGRRNRSRRSRKTSISADVPLLRWVGPTVTVAALVTILGMVVSGKIDFSSLDSNATVDAAASGLAGSAADPAVAAALARKSNETIRVATFNVQAFRESGSEPQQRIGAIGKIVSQFDIVAIQGLHGGDAATVKSVIDWLAQAGGQYTATISDPVGPPGETLSYAFLWDFSRISLAPAGAQVVQDPADRMRFEPMFASFETRVGNNNGRNPFRFTVINSQAASPAELDVLADVFISVRNYVWETTGEEDFLLVGNLANGSGVDAGDAALGRLGHVPGLVSVAATNRPFQSDGTPVQSPVPNAARSHNRILLDPGLTAEFTGKSGTLELAEAFGAPNSETPDSGTPDSGTPSSELPTWAELGIFEVPRFDQPVGSRTRLIR